MLTKEILRLWRDQEACPDFEPILIQVLSELHILRGALHDISQSCPLLNQDKNKMHEPGSDVLFAQSTTIRMEKAKKALVDAKKLWEPPEVTAPNL